MLTCVVPFPNVSVTAFYQTPLLLRCDVSIVSGITSNAVIVWKVNDTEVEQYNGNITEDNTSYGYYYTINKTNDMLTVNNTYTAYYCQVVVETIPPINGTVSITINVGEYI